MKTKLIEIDDVNLKSLQVQIKALTVSGKQVTQSVFRQIPEKKLIKCSAEDDDIAPHYECSLNGIAWGWINYFWKDNEADLHVLWQQGDCLYRSLIHEPTFMRCRNYWDVDGAKDMYDQERRRLNNFHIPEEPAYKEPDKIWEIVSDAGGRRSVQIDFNDATEEEKSIAKENAEKDFRRSLEYHKNKIEELSKLKETIEMEKAFYENSLEASRKMKIQKGKLFNDLKQLPQLYIAM